jgi:WhiB family redox-sensing transcriptional regulator
MSALDYFISEMSNKDFSWQEQAACRGANTDMFFLEEDQTKINQKKLAAAREMCAECLVAEKCLDFALDNYIDFGIWAGTTPLQRKGLRREQRRS